MTSLFYGQFRSSLFHIFIFSYSSEIILRPFKLFYVEGWLDFRFVFSFVPLQHKLYGGLSFGLTLDFLCNLGWQACCYSSLDLMMNSVKILCWVRWIKFYGSAKNLCIVPFPWRQPKKLTSLSSGVHAQWDPRKQSSRQWSSSLSTCFFLYSSVSSERLLL